MLKAPSTGCELLSSALQHMTHTLCAGGCMLHQGRGHRHFPAAVPASESSLAWMLDATACPSSLLAPVTASDPLHRLKIRSDGCQSAPKLQSLQTSSRCLLAEKAGPARVTCYCGEQVSKDVGSGVTHYVCVHIASETTTKEMRAKDPSSPVALPKLPDGMAEVATAR